MAHIGLTVRDIRQGMRMTQDELAQRTGLSVRAIRDIEQGRADPRGRSLQRLAAALDRKDLGSAGTDLSLRIQILGPMQVRLGNEVVDLASETRQVLLGLLALHPGQVISAGEMAEVLWPAGPPASWKNLIHVHLSRLRTAIEPGRGPRELGRVIVSAQTGYRLVAGPDELDLVQFGRLATLGDAAASRSEAYQRYGLALGCWRGSLLTGADARLSGHPSATAIQRRRLTVALAYAELALALGKHEHTKELLRELSELEPMHERLHALLMTVLARSGEQAAALDLYLKLRQRLADDLGLDPGPELQAAHQAVLKMHHIPRQLPPAVRHFTGRTSELSQLDIQRTGDPASIVLVSGMGGIGKTALVVHWAHRAAASFPDGQLYLDLRGYHSRTPMAPAEVVNAMLHALDVPGDRIPPDADQAAALCRSTLAGRRILIILDNARDADQVRPVLPASPGSMTLVTSRDVLGGLVARDGAVPLLLGALPDADANHLLGSIIGSPRANAEPAALAELAAICGHLPLALRLAATQLALRPDSTIASHTSRLGAGNRVAALSIDGDPHSSMLAVLDQSYQALTVVLQQAFRLLGAVPGTDLTIADMAALAGTTEASATSILDNLAAACLIEQNHQGRYKPHDLVRQYAYSLSQREPDAARAALERLLSYQREAAAHANALITPGLSAPSVIPGLTDSKGAFDWLEAQRANLTAAVAAAAAAGFTELAYAITQPLCQFFYHAGHLSDWISTFECAYATVADTNDAVKYQLLHDLAGAHIRTGRLDEGIAQALKSAAGFEALNDAVKAARSRVSVAHAYELQGRYPEAFTEISHALAVYRQHGDRTREIFVLSGTLPNLQNQMGQHAQARDTLLHASEMALAFGGKIELAQIKHHLGHTYRLLAEPGEALQSLSESLTLARESGDRRLEIAISHSIGEVQHDLGDYDTAIALLAQARAEWHDMGVRTKESECLNHLGNAYAAAGHTSLALETYIAAQAITEQTGQQHEMAHALAGIGKVLIAGDPAAATLRLEAAIGILEVIAPHDADDLRHYLQEHGL